MGDWGVEIENMRSRNMIAMVSFSKEGFDWIFDNNRLRGRIFDHETF